MAEKTKIQWCDHTFNPWIGCSKVSEGCKNCYAEQLMANRYHRVQWGPEGTRSRTKTWNDPVKWNKQAGSAGECRKVFCASLADVFEERAELVPWREDLFMLIDKTPNLYWLLLTKRPENIASMWPSDGMLRENVWLGTSVSNQKNADECIDRLIANRYLADKLFISLEPQISRVTLRPWLMDLHWVITGGESEQGGPARDFDIEWARLTKKECAEAAVPWFMKQFGSNAFDNGMPLFFKDKHGGDIQEWPEEFHCRECPETYYPVVI